VNAAAECWLHDRQWPSEGLAHSCSGHALQHLQYIELWVYKALLHAERGQFLA
jgi:hypothetical protein